MNENILDKAVSSGSRWASKNAESESDDDVFLISECRTKKKDIGVKEKIFDSSDLLTDDVSDEIQVVGDRLDPVTVSSEEKKKFEEKLRNYYEDIRKLGPKLIYKASEAGWKVMDCESVDALSTMAPVKYQTDLILRVVNKYHLEAVPLETIAIQLNIDMFEVIMSLLDHIWNARDKTLEGYSIAYLLGYYGIDATHVRLVSGLIFSGNHTLSSLIIHTFCESVELAIILTVLLAQMYGWSVFRDLEGNWNKIAYVKIPANEKKLNTSVDYQLIKKETTEMVENWRKYNEENLIRPLENKYQSLLKASDRMLELMEKIKIGVSRLPGKPSSNAKRTLCLVRKRPYSFEAGSKVTNSSSKTNMDTEAPCDEISVIGEKKNENSGDQLPFIDDPDYLDNIPIGTFCLAQHSNSINFIRCQIINKLDGKYRVLFNDGNEEEVGLSRIALRVEGRLQTWEGVRVCALYKPRASGETFRKAYYSGIVAVGPHGWLKNNMMIFFDNGCDKTVSALSVHILAEQVYAFSNGKKIISRRLNWSLMPKSRQTFVKHYLNRYPDWPLMQMRRKENTQRINIMREKKPRSAYVLLCEKLFALLRFPNQDGPNCVNVNCTRHRHIDEWIYRGSDRLNSVKQTLERWERLEKPEILEPKGYRYRRAARSKYQQDFTLPCFTTELSDEEDRDVASQNSSQQTAPVSSQSSLGMQNLARKQTARKTSTRLARLTGSQSFSNLSGLSQHQKKMNIKYEDIPTWTDHYMKAKPHDSCGPQCVKDLEKNLLNKPLIISPFMLPLLVGWTRQVMKVMAKQKITECHCASPNKIIFYCSPCGQQLFKHQSIARYLKETQSELTIDSFTFDAELRPEVLYTSQVEYKIMDDYTGGKEAIPIPVYNEIDLERPPKMIYEATRYPFNRETSIMTVCPQFCTGCSCTGDCADEEQCECRLLTVSEMSRLDKSLRPSRVKGYNFRRMPFVNKDDKFLSGIYECNDNCNCSKRFCHNRVVQQPIKIPMELFKTEKTGWGLRSCVDIPAGSFVCTYAGAVLNDNQAESTGKEFGDEYFADIDLVDIVEMEKRNAGIDVEDINCGYYSDDQQLNNDDDDLEDQETEEDYLDDSVNYDSANDSNTESSFLSSALVDRVKKVRRRKTKYDDTEVDLHSAVADLECATSSIMIDENARVNDETKRDEESELTERTAFNILKYAENENVPPLFIVDAKQRGNIGRFFNHSCEPNLKTHHIFVDTHDLRLPWIAFFTVERIRAGEEMCWDYGYLAGAVHGKYIKCFCGSKKCRKRLL